jgi:hypothetical protein
MPKPFRAIGGSGGYADHGCVGICGGWVVITMVPISPGGGLKA